MVQLFVPVALENDAFRAILEGNSTLARRHGLASTPGGHPQAVNLSRSNEHARPKAHGSSRIDGRPIQARKSRCTPTVVEAHVPGHKTLAMWGRQKTKQQHLDEQRECGKRRRFLLDAPTAARRWLPRVTIITRTRHTIQHQHLVEPDASTQYKCACEGGTRTSACLQNPCDAISRNRQASRSHRAYSPHVHVHDLPLVVNERSHARAGTLLLSRGLWYIITRAGQSRYFLAPRRAWLAGEEPSRLVDDICTATAGRGSW